MREFDSSFDSSFDDTSFESRLRGPATRRFGVRSLAGFPAIAHDWRQSMIERIRFLGSWRRNPLRVGALAPSSRSLCRLMVSEISHRTGSVIELGPGTGAITRELLARGVAASDLTLIEADASFAQALRYRFAGVRVLTEDATGLAALSWSRDSVGVGAIVSGLPLLSMPAASTEAVLAGAFARHLRPDGRFYQFTYGPRCPVPREVLARHGLMARRIAFTWANLPPASVYRIERTSRPR